MCKLSKRTLLVALTLAMIVAALALVACDNSSSAKGLEYTLNDDGQSYAVSGIGLFTNAKLVIPSTYRYKPVTSIGSGAFAECFSLTSVTIPDSITSIGFNAFLNCINLTKIEIPTSVMFIGDEAFGGCAAITIYCKATGKPEGWMSSWNNARPVVWNCSVNDKDIDGYAYDVIDGVRYSLKNRVATVVVQANNINVANIPSEVTYREEKYSVTSIVSCAFLGCAELNSINIPDSVTEIGLGAFYACTSLTSITIPKCVTSIGNYAFTNCDSLATVHWNAMDYVSESTWSSIFADCSALNNVVIGDNVKTIPDCAFYGCAGLTSVTIPDSVTKIGNQAFIGCISLESIAVGAGNANYSSQDGILYNKTKTQILLVPQAINGRVTIPNGVTEIKKQAFKNCIGLPSIDLPDSVTKIGEEAFFGCSSLTKITLPNSLTAIDKYAFCGCASLAKTTIPDSVTAIGDGVFNGCDNLKYNEFDNALYLGNEKNPYLLLVKPVSTEITTCKINENTNFISPAAFFGCGSLTSIAIPNGVTSIGKHTFYNCYDLVSVDLPDSITAIGESAFYNCIRLTLINIPQSLTSIVGYAFDNCDIRTIYWNATNCINESTSSAPLFTGYNKPDLVFIGDNVETIPSYAFYGCKLTSIKIPDSVTEIGESAFCNCSLLTEIKFEGTVAQWQDVIKGDTWKYGVPATKVICSDGEADL